MPELTELTEWQKFFNAIAPGYLKNGFTAHTRAECDFLVEELKLTPGCRILDVGCGVGRHAIELSRRGYRVTGLDSSAGMLAQARASAGSADVEVEWIEADATALALPEEFDAAVCICEGGFGLLNPGENPALHDRAILVGVHQALRPGAPLLLNALNGLRLLRDVQADDVESEDFDPFDLVVRVKWDWQQAGGAEPGETDAFEQGYAPDDLRELCEEAGFKVEHLWGGTAGHWNRRPPTEDDIELMAVMRRG